MLQIFLYFTSFSILFTFDRIFYLEYLNSIEKYIWIAPFIIFPLINCITYGIIVFFRKYRNDIHHKHLLFLAFLNVCYDLIYTISIPRISLISYTIISKISYFIIMTSSYYFLKRRYLYTHYIGIILCLTGILISLIKSSDNKENSFEFILLFLIGVILQSISVVYKEHFIKKIQDLDIFIMIWHINMWQLFWSGIFFFTIFINDINPIKVSGSNINEFLRDAFSCQFKDCHNSLLYLLLSQVFSMTMILINFKIIKEYSCMAGDLLVTVNGPIFLFIMYFLIKYDKVSINEKEKYELNVISYVSLILTFIGSIVYLIKNEYTYKSDEKLITISEL